MDWLELGTTLLGGLLGSKAGGDTTKTTTETQTRDPWAPAQPYLLDNLKTNADLQKYYQQNPFNTQQKQSYENTFGDLNTFRNTTAPGLMQFANNAMTGSGYQRPQYSAPGQAGYGGSRPQTQGPGSGITGPFSVNPGTYAMPDWNAMNPFSVQNAPVAPVAPLSPMAPGGLVSGGLLGGSSIGDGNYGNGNGGNVGGGYDGTSMDDSGGSLGFGSGNIYGIGSEFNTDSALNGASAGSAFGPLGMGLGGLLNGLIGGYMSPAEQAKQVADMDARVMADEARKRAAAFGGGGSGSFGNGSGYNSGFGGDSSHGTQGY